MILLHVAVAALYALAAWALWPPSAPAAAKPAPAMRPPAAWASVLLPAAIALHAWLSLSDVATPSGLDLSLANAPSIVAWIAVAVAWVSGLLRALPALGAVVLPIAAVLSLLPALWTNTHRYAYVGDPLATAHIAVAFIAYALFIIAAVMAFMLMGLEKRLHRRLPDPGAGSAPPLLTLEKFLFRLIAAGFLLLTLTLASGMLFSEQIFGKPLTFGHQVGHKIVFSALSWLTFGALLWGRARYGWRGRVALRWIIVGTVFVFLAYLGSKFVLEVLLGR